MDDELEALDAMHRSVNALADQVAAFRHRLIGEGFQAHAADYMTCEYHTWLLKCLDREMAMKALIQRAALAELTPKGRNKDA